MSGRSIDELADRIRQRLDRDADQMQTAWTERRAFADELATMQCTTVMMSGWRAHRELAMKRDMLARLLGESHHYSDDYYECCPHFLPDPNDNRPCTCGRDDRVRGYLELLAGVDEAEVGS